MTAYLLRFDDICPTMNWSVWTKVERILDEADVRPILAVVPDNRHPALRHGPPLPAFWDRVRDWQGRGWTIGLHGYQHTEETRSGGLLRLNKWSEFAGLPYETQLSKLQQALSVFDEYEVPRPNLWVAPGHSFDKQTLKALAAVGIETVSDGLAPRPYTDARGMFWIPQQMWRLRQMPVGVWTFGLHINSWTQADVDSFERFVTMRRRRFASVERIRDRYGRRSKSPIDSWCEAAYRTSRFLFRDHART